uniref:S-methyl-5-thioribose kinase n=1 Tax=Halomonas sp. TaxID=1486246 RepID=UPI002615990F|nr:S-methyl-5-thioribose kinase [Halomonas sp.]
MSQNFPRPLDYRILGISELAPVMAKVANVAAILGGHADHWQTDEISDGNMNAVYRLSGPNGSVIIKQALPYIRVIGEDWPFPVSRIDYEAQALGWYNRLTPHQSPQMLHHDHQLGVMVMEDLRHHCVARLAFIRGQQFPDLGVQLGDFLAHSLFFTSDYHLSTPQKKSLAATFCGNAVLCETTEDVIFTSPYHHHPMNRVSPGTESMARQLRADIPLKLAVTQMKQVFRTRSEALIHGDLHTGSIMLKGSDNRVIDAEWAFHGPMGFDSGVLMGNLLMAAISQPGHRQSLREQEDMSHWLLSCIHQLWQRFTQRFRALAHTHAGDFISAMHLDVESLDMLLDRHLHTILADSLGFAGAEIIRRIIGIAHVEDFEHIANPSLRADLEQQALQIARQWLLKRHEYHTLGDALLCAERLLCCPSSRPE